MDCSDECPVNALGTDTSDGCGLGFVPDNLDVSQLNPTVADATTTINCSAVLNTSGTPSFTTWCGGTRPQITIHSQSSGPGLAVVAFRNLNINSGSSLRIQGSRPAVLVVFGNATIAGTIDASASGTTAYAGGNYDCDANAPEPVDADSGDDETSGGGGGGFGTAGGYGGKGDDTAKVAGGSTRGTASLVPLLGGCPGGIGGLCGSAGSGAGGGAIQLSVGGTLTLSGTVRANGGDGPNRCGGYLGGGGGGSGGAIKIDAVDLVTSSPTIQANGGDGGDSRSSYGTTNGGSGSTNSSAAGGDGEPTGEIGADLFGGGGGGGGYGRIVLCNRTTSVGCP